MICGKLRDTFGQEPGVKEWWTLGKVGSVDKVNFNSNAEAWAFLRKYKNRGSRMVRGSCGLRGSTKEEVLLKRGSLAIKHFAKECN